MRRPLAIAKEQAAMATIVELTSAFEGIASLRIAQIKNQVLESQKFFSELWNIYRQLAVSTKFGYGKGNAGGQNPKKQLLIAVTAEGGLSGDIDERLIKEMLGVYQPDQHDIMVIGHHGALQLAQSGVGFKKYFKLPEKDENINVTPLVREVQNYHDTIVYYQTYKSLTNQEVRHISLSRAVQQEGQQAKTSANVINEATYIFEPSTFAVVDHLERSMLQIALSQVILDSKLAQYASRFQAMTLARSKADESLNSLKRAYNLAKRANSDERLKEIVNGLKKAGVSR